MRIVKKIFVILGWLCLAACLGFTIYYAYVQRETVRCRSVEVIISPGSPRFMDEEEIAGLVENSGEPIIGHQLSDININQLEAKLSNFTTLNHVEIYRKVDAVGFSFKGKLVVNVDERTPVVRIKNTDEDYYLDLEGMKIPVAPQYVERMMIVTGTIPDESMKKSLINMAVFVNKDEFWRAQIEQVFVQENGELLILPQVGDCLIEFGPPEDYKLKLRNLKAVYQQGFKNFGWNKYKTICLKYRNQVVCTKK